VCSRLLTGKPSRNLTISTFHALGVRILREDAGTLGYKPTFSILDSSDCFGIVSELAGSTDKATIRKLQALISNWKKHPDLAGRSTEKRPGRNRNTRGKRVRELLSRKPPSAGVAVAV
jgi:superfamily I DNA/RNA helicase